MATTEKYRDELPHLSRGKAIGEGLGEVVRACCAVAAKPGAGNLDARAVHVARRVLKRARAVLRLGEALGVAGAMPARRRLTRLARELSPRRDAVVVRKIARRLAEKLEKKMPEETTAPGRSESGTEETKWWGQWKQKLVAEAGRLERVAWGEPTLDDVRRALQRTAKQVCKRADKVRRKGDIASAHEWRKAVIVLREQVLVVRPWLGNEVEMVGERLHSLALRLGRATDYNVFVEAVRRRDGSVESPEVNSRLAKIGCARRRRAIKNARRRWPKVRRSLRKISR